jgi:hypothetical protein
MRGRGVTGEGHQEAFSGSLRLSRAVDDVFIFGANPVGRGRAQSWRVAGVWRLF